MRALFPPWSDTVFRLCLVVAAVGVFSIPVSMMLWVRTPYVTKQDDPVDQPVQFDHRHHVRDDGIGCLYCHYEAERSAYAGAPPTSVCMNCHSQVWQESERLEPVRRSWFTGEPLRWQRVHQLPQFVYFDHSAHVSHGVGCVECHGRVDQMIRVRAMQPLSMGWCLECHRDPAPHLRPVEYITKMDWEPPEGETRESFGEKLREKNKIAPPTDCSRCHR